MFYGNWLTSERVRYAGGNSEILVGENAEGAAQALKLTISSWNNGGATPQYTAFAAWVRSHIDAGHPVVGTVFSIHGDASGELEPDSEPASATGTATVWQ